MGITPQQFKQLQDRLEKPRRKAVPVGEGFGAPAVARRHEVVMGVDPSLRGTGYGVIRSGRANPSAVVYGTISCPASWEHSRCLARIAQTLRDVVREHRPTICLIEGLFYAQNLQTSLVMGEARGAALAALAEGGVEIYEMAPRKVKQAIVGYGAAEKVAVAKMVQRMLRLSDLPAADAADALALALTQLQEQGRYSLRAQKRV